MHNANSTEGEGEIEKEKNLECDGKKKYVTRQSRDDVAFGWWFWGEGLLGL